jgi:hypothetical protein
MILNSVLLTGSHTQSIISVSYTIMRSNHHGKMEKRSPIVIKDSVVPVLNETMGPTWTLWVSYPALAWQLDLLQADLGFLIVPLIFRMYSI